ncbi:MAG: 4-hydroxyphenylpyruvate dioxygenase [Alphaproteobacteria bacterium]
MCAATNNISLSNPLGTDGFEFVEFSAPDPVDLEALFIRLGFSLVALHRSKKVRLWRQGEINFIVNAEENSQAAEFARLHGPCVNAMALRVADAALALKTACAKGARQVSSNIGVMELNIPAIEGIGGSLLYLVDRYGTRDIYSVDFNYLPGVEMRPQGAGLTHIDHLTHNVEKGRMDVWAKFYEDIFNFREIRYFDIEGRHTGLHSRALCSPCGKIRIPINESADDKSQIAEYLRDYKGEGIQHIALATGNIVQSVEKLADDGINFLEAPPATYYQQLDGRLPEHGQDISVLQKHGILMDGSSGGKILLQIFTRTVIGPIFFELIERHGDEGFGEGNFKALFEAMEQDQIRRGTLAAE